MPWLPCFQISAAGCMCYCVSNQQYFFPESLSIFETFLYSQYPEDCVPFPHCNFTLWINPPFSCQSCYTHTGKPQFPCQGVSLLPTLVSTLPTTAYGSDLSLTASFLHSHSTKLLVMGKLPWQSPCPFLKYILNKEHLFKSVLEWKEGDSAACEMREMHNQGCTSSTQESSTLLFILVSSPHLACCCMDTSTGWQNFLPFTLHHP